MFDRLELRVKGSIAARDAASMESYVGQIGASAEQPRLLGLAHLHGGAWKASAVNGTTISRCDVRIVRTSPNAHLEMVISVNPMRTLGHLLDRYRFDDLTAIEPTDFFAAAPEPTAANLTLDGNDNMVSDYRSFAGTVHRTYLQRVAEFLALFESNLRSKIFAELCPASIGFDRHEEGATSLGRNDDVEVRLDWGDLTVSQAEVCWERYDPDALDKAHEFARQILVSARSASVDTYGGRRGPTVGRNLGAVSTQLPLTPSGDVSLAIYAKARDRLRIEIRYRKDLPEKVRARLPANPHLTDWLNAISEAASERLSAHDFARLTQPVREAHEEALADLLDAVADVTTKAGGKRRPIFLELLRHGSITATNHHGTAPTRILERLASRGVLEHVRLVKKDSKIGRRYRLTEKYLPLVTR
ncbi:hypothetical protein [Qipengyuania seohaensis]|uniref:hypothetical protein n=1 Tax=Qipengyuania seohaensis TaxID=266951 RepID=UPI0012FDB013|nr:hypothetical protein [Qipengyuania seohaensis]